MVSEDSLTRNDWRRTGGPRGGRTALCQHQIRAAVTSRATPTSPQVRRSRTTRTSQRLNQTKVTKRRLTPRTRLNSGDEHAIASVNADHSEPDVSAGEAPRSVNRDDDLMRVGSSPPAIAAEEGRITSRLLGLG